MSGYLISIPEAAETLGVSKYFIYKAIKNGTLKTREFEGRQYVVREGIDAFISGE